MRSICFFLLLTTLSFTTSTGQSLATLEADVSKLTNELAEPASIDLDAITFLPDTLLQFVEVQGNKKFNIPYQIEVGKHRTLHWMLEPQAGKSVKRIFQLLKAPSSGSAKTVRAVTEKGGLILTSGDKKLLRYQFETMNPPEGVDPSYRRSGFIHPLWSPHGQILTRVQPPDHYHHYGIWNPWTHVLYEGDTIDFWNLNGKKGTVRFAKFTSVVEGPLFSEYHALHEHVVFKKDGSEKIALNEIQAVRVYKSSENYYIVDITITMNCAGPSDVLLLEYRYGGLGWRTTEQWDKNNSSVLSSEGKTRKDADGTTARWCIVQGKVDNDHAGVVMMSHPTNYNHPEPLRIWPENQYNRGDMFANFCPTKNKDWLLRSGQDYVLNYRLLVFNGNFSNEQAESAWQHFSKPVPVRVKNN